MHNTHTRTHTTAQERTTATTAQPVRLQPPVHTCPFRPGVVHISRRERKKKKPSHVEPSFKSYTRTKISSSSTAQIDPLPLQIPSLSYTHRRKPPSIETKAYRGGSSRGASLPFDSVVGRSAFSVQRSSFLARVRVLVGRISGRGGGERQC